MCKWSVVFLITSESASQRRPAGMFIGPYCGLRGGDAASLFDGLRARGHDVRFEPQESVFGGRS